MERIKDGGWRSTLYRAFQHLDNHVFVSYSRPRVSHRETWGFVVPSGYIQTAPLIVQWERIEFPNRAEYDIMRHRECTTCICILKIG